MLALLLFAAQAAATAEPAPVISLHATLQARSVKVEKKGEATIRAWAQPDGGSTARSSGTRRSGYFTLELDSRLAPPADPSAKAPETSAQPPR